MAKLKVIFQYTIYPFFMISAAIIMVAMVTSGKNQYLATTPVIIFYGVLALLLERWMPFEKSWLNGSDWNLDFTYYIINYLIKVTAQFALIWLSTSVSFLQWFPTTLPFWLQVLLALIIIDFFLFFVHWQSHRYQWLWKLHAVHHSSERLYFLNGEKRHALHQIIEGSPGIILCLIIGTPQPVVVTALALLAINMMMQHTNLNYRAGILKKFFCVAELHRWHHRSDYKDAQVNYGAWLTLWDYIFNTAYDNPKIYQTQGIGQIGIKEESNFPRSYWRQFLYPFKKGNK
jgi:sterol desaturase/sphingolipid hydroxylase (fatty acid hydroxylase superfamily)